MHDQMWMPVAVDIFARTRKPSHVCERALHIVFSPRCFLNASFIHCNSTKTLTPRFTPPRRCPPSTPQTAPNRAHGHAQQRGMQQATRGFLQPQRHHHHHGLQSSSSRGLLVVQQHHRQQQQQQQASAQEAVAAAAAPSTFSGLSPQQLQQFEEDGFLAIPGFASPQQVGWGVGLGSMVWCAEVRQPSPPLTTTPAQSTQRPRAAHPCCT